MRFVVKIIMSDLIENSYFSCEGGYILRVISKDEAIILWDKLNNEFKFKPGTDITGE